MKRIWKGALACSMMALAVPMLVACDKTPAWQKVDNINTNANYSTVEYNDIYGVLTATGDDALTTMTGKKVKIAYSVSSEDLVMEVAGVFDSTTGGEADDVKQAVKIKMKMNMGEMTMSTEAIIYLTKAQTCYIDAKTDMDGEKENMKIMVTAFELLGLMQDPSMGEMLGFVKNLTDIYEVPAIIGIYESEESDQGKFTYGIAENEKTGVTKYKKALKDDITVTESVDFGIGQGAVDASVTKGLLYMAVDKDNVVYEAFANAKLEVDQYDFATGQKTGTQKIDAKISINEYKSAMPTHGSGYQSYAEWMASQQGGQD